MGLPLNCPCAWGCPAPWAAVLWKLLHLWVTRGVQLHLKDEHRWNAKKHMGERSSSPHLQQCFPNGARLDAVCKNAALLCWKKGRAKSACARHKLHCLACWWNRLQPSVQFKTQTDSSLGNAQIAFCCSVKAWWGFLVIQAQPAEETAVLFVSGSFYCCPVLCRTPCSCSLLLLPCSVMALQYSLTFPSSIFFLETSETFVLCSLLQNASQLLITSKPWKTTAMKGSISL